MWSFSTNFCTSRVLKLPDKFLKSHMIMEHTCSVGEKQNKRWSLLIKCLLSLRITICPLLEVRELRMGDRGSELVCTMSSVLSHWLKKIIVCNVEEGFLCLPNFHPSQCFVFFSSKLQLILTVKMLKSKGNIFISKSPVPLGALRGSRGRLYGAQEGESTPPTPLLFKQRVLSYWGPDLVQKIQKRQSAPSISSSEDPTFLLLLRGWKVRENVQWINHCKAFKNQLKTSSFSLFNTLGLHISVAIS